MTEIKPTRLSAFRINSKARDTGEWVSLGEEFGTIEVFSRGYGDSYNDMRAARVRRSALAHAGNADRIPTAVFRDITLDCLFEHVLFDVRNAADDEGKSITFDQFKAMLRHPDYAEVYAAVLNACAMVGRRRDADTGDAAKN